MSTTRVTGPTRTDRLLGSTRAPSQHDTYRTVKARLGELVGELAAAGETRLPTEDELSVLLEVSRATIRSALLSLQKEGRIQKIHGRGTFINRHVAAIRANIAQDWPFIDLLTKLGHEVSVRNEPIRSEHATPAIASALGVPEDTDTYVLHRRFEVETGIAVYCVDYLPARYVKAEPAEGYSSVFEYVNRCTGRQIRYSVAEIVPVTAPPDVASVLGVAEGSPLLLLKHLHVDDGDDPIAYTRAYINDEFIRFSVVRSYLSF